MAVQTGDEFLGVLQKSSLLNAARLEEARRLAKGLEDPAEIARKLVQHNLISRWQSKQLLAGKHAFFISKYRLLDLLGNDAVGPIFLAEHTQMDRRVVLKTLARRDGNTTGSIDRFLSETAMLAALDHRHLSHVYDVDREGDFYYLVMEHVQGRNLQQVVESDGPLAIEAAAGLIGLAADAVGHAHKQGVLHLGLRPDRLVVDGQGMLKVLDIGVARLAAKESPDGSRIQQKDAWSYCAPEQLSDGPPPDARADVYALGAVLHLLLTGEPPEPRTTAESPPPDVRQLRPDVPAELAQICQKMLAYQPQDRYDTATEAAAALETWLQQAEATRAAAKPATERLRGGATVATETSAAASEFGVESDQGPAAVTESGAVPVQRAPDRRMLYIGGGVGAGLVLVVVLLAAVFFRGDGTMIPDQIAANSTTVSHPVPLAAPEKNGGTTGEAQPADQKNDPEIESKQPSDKEPTDQAPDEKDLPIVAYWRFEKPDKPLTGAGAAAAPDESGNKNHLFLEDANAPVQFATSVAAVKVRSNDQPNIQCLDDTQLPKGKATTRALTTKAGHAEREKSPLVLAATKFNTWTVEASFLLDQLGFTHTLVGKDGPQGADAKPLLQLRVRGNDNRVEIQAVDSTGETRRAQSADGIVAERWYHVVAASNGLQLRLWVDAGDGRGLQEQEGAEFKGPLQDGPGEWSVGRGFNKGQPAEDAVALIDEVRITAKELDPPQMLMHATPEQLQAEKKAPKPPPRVLASTPAGGKLAFHPLNILSVTGPEGVEFKLQPDGSYLVTGENPGKAEYTIRAKTELTQIRGFQLEALADLRLPGAGPGRHTDKSKEQNGNFLVTGITVAASGRETEMPGAVIAWREAKADFSQDKFPVASMIDTKPTEGWAVSPKVGEGHYAMLFAEKPLGYPRGTWLTMTIQQNAGASLALGRFRVTAFTGDKPGENPGGALQAANQMAKPLSKLPPRVSLPPLPAEGESATDEALAVVSLGQVYHAPEVPVEMKLLGGDAAFEAEGPEFRLERHAKVPEGNGRWQILLQPAEAAPGDSTVVAEVAAVGTDLKFRWTKAGAVQPLANHLRNCVLEVSVADRHHGLVLREPTGAPRLDLGFGKGSKQARFDVPWLPKIAAVKVSLPSKQAGMPDYAVSPDVISASKGKAEITFSEQGQPDLISVIECSAKKGLQFNVGAYYLLDAEGKRQSYSRTKVDRARQQAATQIERMKVQLANLEKPLPQGVQLLPRSAALRDQLKKQIPEGEKLLPLISKTLERADNIEKSGGLSVQVFAEVGRYRVPLAESGKE